ncbi:uncharacterized protein LOC102346599 isoform X2 [Latimeria chalumnae]|uniref:uncharacterized protein LOC102346599 isoform X2 n=1 Tax=Latimeria chalumnae TaxID=7897 RepID=UPI0003C0FB82|nr:PREDICTED: 182 kDa tankyrase-1-binding protein isoform X2 [Latimeria chalumnae]|eukprot:XP_006011382.1 PREDICTED: 182 kDa tankyrase-1-binding protein isoform X2 [Latimeria chalumnae]
MAFRVSPQPLPSTLKLTSPEAATSDLETDWRNSLQTNRLRLQGNTSTKPPLKPKPKVLPKLDVARKPSVPPAGSTAQPKIPKSPRTEVPSMQKIHSLAGPRPYGIFNPTPFSIKTPVFSPAREPHRSPKVTSDSPLQALHEEHPVPKSWPKTSTDQMGSPTSEKVGPASEGVSPTDLASGKQKEETASIGREAWKAESRVSSEGAKEDVKVRSSKGLAGTEHASHFLADRPTSLPLSSPSEGLSPRRYYNIPPSAEKQETSEKQLPKEEKISPPEKKAVAFKVKPIVTARTRFPGTTVEEILAKMELPKKETKVPQESLLSEPRRSWIQRKSLPFEVSPKSAKPFFRRVCSSSEEECNKEEVSQTQQGVAKTSPLVEPLELAKSDRQEKRMTPGSYVIEAQEVVTENKMVEEKWRKGGGYDEGGGGTVEPSDWGWEAAEPRGPEVKVPPSMSSDPILSTNERFPSADSRIKGDPRLMGNPSRLQEAEVEGGTSASPLRAPIPLVEISDILAICEEALQEDTVSSAGENEFGTVLVSILETKESPKTLESPKKDDPVPSANEWKEESTAEEHQVLDDSSEDSKEVKQAQQPTPPWTTGGRSPFLYPNVVSSTMGADQCLTMEKSSSTKRLSLEDQKEEEAPTTTDVPNLSSDKLMDPGDSLPFLESLRQKEPLEKVTIECISDNSSSLLQLSNDPDTGNSLPGTNLCPASFKKDSTEEFNVEKCSGSSDHLNIISGSAWERGYVEKSHSEKAEADGNSSGHSPHADVQGTKVIVSSWSCLETRDAPLVEPSQEFMKIESTIQEELEELEKPQSLPDPSAALGRKEGCRRSSEANLKEMQHDRSQEVAVSVPPSEAKPESLNSSGRLVFSHSETMADHTISKREEEEEEEEEESSALQPSSEALAMREELCTEEPSGKESEIENSMRPSILEDPVTEFLKSSEEMPSKNKGMFPPGSLLKGFEAERLDPELETLPVIRVVENDEPSSGAVTGFNEAAQLRYSPKDENQNKDAKLVRWPGQSSEHKESEVHADNWLHSTDPMEEPKEDDLTKSLSNKVMDDVKSQENTANHKAKDDWFMVGHKAQGSNSTPQEHVNSSRAEEGGDVAGMKPIVGQEDNTALECSKNNEAKDYEIPAEGSQGTSLKSELVVESPTEEVCLEGTTENGSAWVDIWRVLEPVKPLIEVTLQEQPPLMFQRDAPNPGQATLSMETVELATVLDPKEVKFSSSAGMTEEQQKASSSEVPEGDWMTLLEQEPKPEANECLTGLQGDTAESQVLIDFGELDPKPGGTQEQEKGVKSSEPPFVWLDNLLFSPQTGTWKEEVTAGGEPQRKVETEGMVPLDLFQGPASPLDFGGEGHNHQRKEQNEHFFGTDPFVQHSSPSSDLPGARVFETQEASSTRSSKSALSPFRKDLSPIIGSGSLVDEIFGEEWAKVLSGGTSSSPPPNSQMQKEVEPKPCPLQTPEIDYTSSPPEMGYGSGLQEDEEEGRASPQQPQPVDLGVSRQLGDEEEQGNCQRWPEEAGETSQSEERAGSSHLQYADERDRIQSEEKEESGFSQPESQDTEDWQDSTCELESVDAGEMQEVDFSFIEVTEVLDSAVQRDRVSLSRKRCHRAPAPRTGWSREGEGKGESWMFRDTTESKVVKPESSDEEVEDPKTRRVNPPANTQKVRVAIFPGIDPSALKARLRPRHKSTAETDETETETAMQVQRSKSCRNPTETSGGGGGGTGGLLNLFRPKPERSSGSEGSSPSWLQALKLKKKVPK